MNTEQLLARASTKIRQLGLNPDDIEDWRKAHQMLIKKEKVA